MCLIDVRCAALCLILSAMAWCHVQAQPYLDEGPTDATIREGETVNFVCDLRNVSGYSVYWHYEGQLVEGFLSNRREIYQESDLPADFLSRLSIIGDERQDVFTLRIENVQEADGGAYSCRYALNEADAKVTTVSEATLTVLVPPSPQSPLCSVQPSLGYMGDLIYLNCEASDGSPLPHVTYYKKGERVSGPSRSIAQSYILTAEDNGVTFTCSMTTPALDEPRNCSVMPLRILPNATIQPAASRFEEGSHASFECYGEGVPSIASYRWTVINTDTGEIIPSERFIVSDDGRFVEIAVHGNLELFCTVSVPSGLSSNSTSRVEVIKSTSSPTLAIVVVVVVLAFVAIVIIVLCLWRLRKRQRKSKIPIDPIDGYKMSDIGDEYAEVGRPGQNGDTTKAGMDKEKSTKLSMTWDHQRDVPGVQSCTDISSGASLYAKPDKQAKTPQDAVNTSYGPRTNPHPPDTPLYAQPDKSKQKRMSEDVIGSGYSTVAADEPVKTESGLVYANLPLASHNTEPSSSSEQTQYATVRA